MQDENIRIEQRAELPIADRQLSPPFSGVAHQSTTELHDRTTCIPHPGNERSARVKCPLKCKSCR
eukprot:scaffold118735_cov29-Tisochrysis_lutea.AAC.1